MLHLKNLNESFDKLYEVNEPLHEGLNEAFGDTFPKWLKTALADSRKHYGYKPYSVSPRHGYEMNIGQSPDKASRQVADVVKPKGFKGNLDAISLFNLAISAGIDLQNAQITEAEVPASTKDPIMQDETIVRIWGFPSGQVYIEGLNESEKCVDDPKEWPFRYFTPKKLITLANHFAYMSASDLNPSYLHDKDVERNQHYSDLVQMYNDHPEMIRNNIRKEYSPMDIPTFEAGKRGGHFDASGYMIDPTRYEDKLKTAKGKRVFDDLAHLYKAINRTYTQYVDAITEYDFENEESQLDISSMDIDQFSRWQYQYNDLVRKVNRVADALKQGDITEQVALNYYSEVRVDVKSELDDVLEHSRELYSAVDWLR